MKLISRMVVLLALAGPVFAEDISEAAVAGNWLNTSPVYTEGDMNDQWEFLDGQFVQNLDGQRIPSGTYKMANGTIECQYWTTEVMSFGGGKMTAKMGATVYTLEKQ